MNELEKKLSQITRMCAVAPLSSYNAMKRVREETERFTRHDMKNSVKDYLVKKCLGDAEFAACVVLPQKSMANCFRYISRKALEYLKQQEKDMPGHCTTPGISGYSGDVPDDLCYQWAEEYFRDLDAEEDREPEKPVKKPAGESAKMLDPRKKSAKKGEREEEKAEDGKEKAKEIEEGTDGQMSLFDQIA